MGTTIHSLRQKEIRLFKLTPVGKTQGTWEFLCWQMHDESWIDFNVTVVWKVVKCDAPTEKECYGQHIYSNKDTYILLVCTNTRIKFKLLNVVNVGTKFRISALTEHNDLETHWHGRIQRLVKLMYTPMDECTVNNTEQVPPPALFHRHCTYICVYIEEVLQFFFVNVEFVRIVRSCCVSKALDLAVFWGTFWLLPDA